MQKLNEHIRRTSACNYPIENSLLEKETDYMKNSYCKMLAVILQQGDDITEEQRSLFLRIVSGVQTDYSIEDYFRQALEIEIEDYEEFTIQCRELPLRYRFVMDAMLLACCDRSEDEQLKLVAAFMEAFQMDKTETEYIAKLCRSILEQDEELFRECEQCVIPELSMEHIAVYCTSYVKDIILLKEDSAEICAGAKHQITEKTWEEIYNKIQDKGVVILLNECFDMSQTYLSFHGNKKI